MRIETIDDAISEFLKQINSESKGISEVDGIPVQTSSGIYIDLLYQKVRVEFSHYEKNLDHLYKSENWFFPLENFLPYIKLLQEKGKADVREYGALVIRQSFVFENHFVVRESVERGLIDGELSLAWLVLNVDFKFVNEAERSFPTFDRLSYN